jgi:hypothetical protein
MQSELGRHPETATLHKLRNKGTLNFLTNLRFALHVSLFLRNTRQRFTYECSHSNSVDKRVLPHSYQSLRKAQLASEALVHNIKTLPTLSLEATTTQTPGNQPKDRIFDCR